MITLYDGAVWWTDPKALWTLQYEYRRIGADMQYRFYWKVWLNYSTSWWYNAMQLNFYIDGLQFQTAVKDDKIETGWSYEGTTEWFTVKNKTTGSALFYVQLNDISANTTDATSSTYYLAVAPYGAELVSATDFTDEQNPSIQYSNPAGSGVSSLQACLSLTGDVDDVGYRDIPLNGTSYIYELTDEERKLLRDNTPENSRTVWFCIKTVIDGTAFYSRLERIMSIVNAAPPYSEDLIRALDVAPGVIEVTGNNELIVQAQSELEVYFTAAEGRKGASIKEYALELDGIVLSSASPGSIYFGKIGSSGDLELTFVVTDSRGNSTSVCKKITVLPWESPVFGVELERLNNYEDETYLTVRASVSSVCEKNQMRIRYRYSESGADQGEWREIQNAALYTLICDKNKTFVFDVIVEDSFDKTEKSFVLYKGTFPLFIDTRRNAVGINEFPEDGEALKVAGGVANFEGGIQMAGVDLLDYIIGGLSEKGLI